MALTSNSDLFASVHEDGFNLIVKHVMQQRPSLFNYGTQYFNTSQGTERLCCRIDANPVVLLRNNPLITVEAPLPIFNSDPYVGLNFVFQLCDFLIDFHPGQLFNLPPELNPPLGEQKVALKISVCGGIGCPDPQWLSDYADQQDNNQDNNNQQPGNDPKTKPDPIPLPFNTLNCFCLDIFAIASVGRKTISGKDYLKFYVEGLEIVDMTPEGLENSIECYVKTLLTISILPKAKIAMETLTFNIAHIISVFPTPISAAVPFNPSIENDQLEVFFNLN